MRPTEPMPRVAAHRIPELLHDAQLLSGEYNPESRELQLTFECLRRHPDGSALEDRKVTLHLAGTTAVTAAYDPLWPEDRPSQFQPPEDARLSALAPWPLPPMEVELSLDSPTAEESLALACCRQSLVNTDDAEAQHLVCLHFSLGLPRVQVLLAVRCASVRPYASGEPLSVEVWEEEFAAWWKGWEDHWRSQEEAPTDADAEAVEEDAFIPAGNADAVDRSYVPPRQPAFECLRTDIPEELLSPLRTWFEAGLALDAAQRASVAPNLDERPEDQIASEQAWMTGDGYGSWDYAREVEAWRIEGDRAYVGVAGVTHYMPMDGDPAENHLSRWAFALHRRGSAWQIHRHTSANDDDLATRPWAQPWRVR